MVFTAIQAWITNKTVNALVKSERAFLLSNITSDSASDAIKPGLRYPNSPTMGHQGDVIVKYDIKNYGRTPAVIRSISHKLICCARLPCSPDYPPPDKSLVEHAIAADAAVAAPECRLEPPLNMQNAIDVAGGNSMLWFYGIVRYDDAFGSPHEYRFLYRYGEGGLRQALYQALQPKHLRQEAPAPQLSALSTSDLNRGCVCHAARD